ncbi:MAG: histidine kinase [Bacteroidota bacterium]
MKSRIQIWLPIALSIALPGVGFIANRDGQELSIDYIFSTWIFISLFLYVLWHLTWLLWDIREKYKETRYLAILAGLFIILLIIAFSVEATSQLTNTKPALFFRTIPAIIIFTTIQFALKKQARISQLKLETEQLKSENYKAQLNTIRAKIDPHFLFNSLNTLRAMVRQEHRNSEQFVISLSDFYRQSLHQNSEATTHLSRELELLNAYLFVMKSRNEKAIHVNMNIDGNLHKAEIPSMALQQVVENCFKHNVMATKQPLTIDIRSIAGNYIEVRNNLRPQILESNTSGYGLNLLKKRYELMNVADGVVISPSESHFIVRLKLI